MPPKRTTTPMTDDTIKQLIAQGVADALAEYEQTEVVEMVMIAMIWEVAEEGQSTLLVSLTQWFEKIESVFYISNCTVGNQIKFATCTSLGSELTWWNSHVKTVGHDAAYGMTCKTLMKMLTDKYRPRSEIKKLEIEI
ncbi:hypothetical protein Tco_0981020 [Tanacetum coccineum]